MCSGRIPVRTTCPRHFDGDHSAGSARRRFVHVSASPHRGNGLLCPVPSTEPQAEVQTLLQSPARRWHLVGRTFREVKGLSQPALLPHLGDQAPERRELGASSVLHPFERSVSAGCVLDKHGRLRFEQQPQWCVRGQHPHAPESVANAPFVAARRCRQAGFQ